MAIPLGIIDVFIPAGHAQDVFAIGADVVAQAGRDATQGPGHIPAAEEQVHRPERTGGDDHASCPDRSACYR